MNPAINGYVLLVKLQSISSLFIVPANDIFIYIYSVNS